MVIIVLAILGVAVIIYGIVAMIKVRRLAKDNNAPKNLRKIHIISIAIGISIGLATWPATYFMGYPYINGDETGRIVGIPFMVAFFDSQGRDYVGPYTMPGVVSNIVFWFFVPQILLLLYSKRNGIKVSS
ncbi:MAG: hypothetical protein HXX11_15995 [Desulfuromonadales bacterium]|nr:hypothetical protein [Desulfuromonadales bacterium]